MHALQVDGRAPFSRIADVLGVSDRTVARRSARGVFGGLGAGLGGRGGCSWGGVEGYP
ncbi:AsnC family protein [Nocardia wallacei]|uniref:AsnC family protein n=1 Tax=Nocardia wallacei TaxID=480035 RepID=UPI002453FFCF|nr:AsnC family protein [Nocardia wallacei]